VTLGFENREQVYFLAGLVVFAGYLMYISLAPRRAAAPAPSHPSTPQRGRKAIGWHPAGQRTDRIPGVVL
jgi:hypothetical protein